MLEPPTSTAPLTQRWFAPAAQPEASYAGARWLFLRALGGIFFSAFLALWFQIDGLIGPRGVLPAGEYLANIRRAIGWKGIWFAPTLLWIDSGSGMLYGIVVAGFVASVTLTFGLWPRMSIAVAGIAFLSFIAAAQDFASYQSDGMLLEAAFLSLFFAPRGLRPGLAAASPPSLAALFLLRWEWFRIYFESGLVKILSGEPQWRNLTAMDKYYENGPLPTWIGWYVQHLPHPFHAATAALTLIVELFVAWLIFFPGRWPRLFVFAIASLLQIGIIVTANYAFLNYLVFALGILLLDDRTLALFGWRAMDPSRRTGIVPTKVSYAAMAILPLHFITTSFMFFDPAFPLARLAEPSRIVNNFGLFAVMTRARYEVEFQGTVDGHTWVAYPFRFKPQDVRERPGIYAPYQPRFDWNLWFSSLGSVGEYPWVLNVEERLLERSPPVLSLFRRDPFAGRAPVTVRTVVWQYWFTSAAERAATGAWWRRELRGPYAPEARRTPLGVEFVTTE